MRFSGGRRQPIACNIWSLARRSQAYVFSLNKLPISALRQLGGGLHCPFLLDFGLTADQRAMLWQAVWDKRTLVRTANLGPVSDQYLLHTI